jgi:hypothetical protein
MDLVFLFLSRSLSPIFSNFGIAQSFKAEGQPCPLHRPSFPPGFLEHRAIFLDPLYRMREREDGRFILKSYEVRSVARRISMSFVNRGGNKNVFVQVWAPRYYCPKCLHSSSSPMAPAEEFPR